MLLIYSIHSSRKQHVIIVLFCWIALQIVLLSLMVVRQIYWIVFVQVNHEQTIANLDVTLSCGSIDGSAPLFQHAEFLSGVLCTASVFILSLVNILLCLCIILH